LIDVAEANFRLDISDDKGITRRQQLQDAEALGRSDGSDWKPEEPPYQLVYIWKWFLELHIGRHFGPHGAEPISYHDMLAWSKLTDRILGPFEIKTIRQLDQRYFYVLRNPDAAGPLDNNQGTEQQLADALRSMAKRGNANESKGGVQALTVGNK
jgi:hypothetical protein